MTFTDDILEYLPHAISPVSAIIAIAALYFTVKTYRQQHVIRNDLKFRIAPPKITIDFTGGHSIDAGLRPTNRPVKPPSPPPPPPIAIKLTAFNMGNRPVVLDQASVTIATGSPDQFESFEKDHRIDHFATKKNFDEDLSMAPIKARIVQPQSIATWDFIDTPPPNFWEKSRSYKYVLFLSAAFYNSKGEITKKNIPFGILQSGPGEGADNHILIVEPFDKQNELIKIF